jgi:hypothetical protein
MTDEIEILKLKLKIAQLELEIEKEKNRTNTIQYIPYYVEPYPRETIITCGSGSTSYNGKDTIGCLTNAD